MRSLHNAASGAVADTSERAPGTSDPQPQKNLVMVVAQSPVNRIVVTRIVERAGIKVLAVDPGAAATALAEHRPTLVVLDTDSTHDGVDPILDAIRARRSSASGFPLAVLLAQRVDSEGLDPCIDAVVAKPITPETLQPVVERLLSDRDRSAQDGEAARISP